MVGDHKRKIVPMLPKWYIVVLANIIVVCLFSDVMITCKTKKVLEMSTDRRKKDRDNSSFYIWDL
jgi:hypothetical protein